jgi:diacylglycerol kinase
MSEGIANSRRTHDSNSVQRPVWRRVLVDFERGLAQGARFDSSFAIYFFLTSVVVAMGFVLGISALEWSVLIVALSLAMSSQMFHQMLRILWKEAEHQLPDRLRPLIRIASAAVGVAIIGAASAIVMLFWQRLSALW